MCHKHDLKPLTKFDPDKTLGYELCARYGFITRYLSIPLETLRWKSNAPSFCIAVPDKRELYLEPQYLWSTLWQLNSNWWKERLYEQIVSVRLSSHFVSRDFSHISNYEYLSDFLFMRKWHDSSSATLATRRRRNTHRIRKATRKYLNYVSMFIWSQRKSY